MVLSAVDLRYTGEWALRLGNDWKMEVPIKMHRGARVLDDGGGPAWTAEFERWLARNDADSQVRDHRGPYQNHPRRIRTTRAFRKLRNAAPVEFNAAYDLCVLNPVRSIDELPSAFQAIARRLNDRAIRKGYPERFTAEQVAILCYSAVAKIAERWL
jgi:hypothetical protein